jgi:hypothetical protein
MHTQALGAPDVGSEGGGVMGDLEHAPAHYEAAIVREVAEAARTELDTLVCVCVCVCVYVCVCVCVCVCVDKVLIIVPLCGGHCEGRG